MLVKRAFDVVISLLIFLFSWPLIMLIALVVRLTLGKPVLFRQTRPGFKGRPFEMVKFRTMKDSVDSDGELLPDSQRITPVGRWLRSTSLDELPELWHVLKGEMSLVGPRPLLMEYLDLYDERQMRRHDVLPGITGWAQVKGRNSLSWEEKLELDVWYVENRSIILDIKIIFMTILVVISRKNINFSEGVTMPKFRGTRR